MCGENKNCIDLLLMVSQNHFCFRKGECAWPDGRRGRIKYQIAERYFASLIHCRNVWQRVGGRERAMEDLQ